jgi:hypothetical protein
MDSSQEGTGFSWIDATFEGAGSDSACDVSWMHVSEPIVPTDAETLLDTFLRDSIDKTVLDSCPYGGRKPLALLSPPLRTPLRSVCPDRRAVKH